MDSSLASTGAVAHEAPAAEARASTDETQAVKEEAVPRGHVPELDGLRGIAIALVLLHHFWPKHGWLAAHALLPAIGWIGVDLFFVISGFLITGILLDTREDPHYYRNFYVRRALRILPLYYLFLFGIFVLYPLSHGPTFGHEQFWREARSPLWYIFYLNNLPTAVIGEQPYWMLHPLWSLAIEEQFYILFPFLVAALRPRTLAVVLSSILLLAPLFRLVTYVHSPGNWYMQFEATPARVDVLAWGCLLALELRRGNRLLTRRFAAVALVAAMLLLVATIFETGLRQEGYAGQVWNYSIIAMAWAALVLWAVQFRGRLGTAPLRLRPLRHLGKICYGLYLLHFPAMDLLLRVSARLGYIWEPYSGLLFVAKCASTLLLAQLSWVFFESRLLRLKKRFDSKTHPAGG